jgi:hypothetical protein
MAGAEWEAAGLAWAGLALADMVAFLLIAMVAPRVVALLASGRPGDVPGRQGAHGYAGLVRCVKREFR